MAQEKIFSANSIELFVSIINKELVLEISIESELGRVTKALQGKELYLFQDIVSKVFYSQAMLPGAGEQLKREEEETSSYLLEIFREKDSNIAWPSSTYYLDKIVLGETNSSRKQIEAEVFIGLPQEEIDLFTIERIQNATGGFMEAMGFELKTQDEPVFGSFFQRLKFLLKGEVKHEVNEIYNKGKTALEAQFIDLPSAEATSKLASSAAELITALALVSDAAIRCGSILLVKVTKDGVPRIITETVSPELAALLNKNPALLQNPSIVFDLISGMRSPDKTIEESGSAELAE